MKQLIISTIVISLFISFQSYSQCNVIPITTTIDGFQISGDYRVYPGNTGACNQIVNPVIIVEAFDPFDNTTNDNNNIYNNANQSNLAIDLRQQGFDIITLNFASTKVPLRRNAALLEELIDEINAMPSVQNDLVVMGLSMGGLIAKYTLSDMESRNKAHNTRMYISMDSPHGGANVPASLRALFSQLYNLYIFPPQLVGGIIVGEFITPMFESGQVLNSQAANEMILDNNANVSSFLSQLKAMDMPSSVNLAIANGSHAGQVQATGLGNNYTPGMVMFSANLDSDVELFDHEVLEAQITHI
jgi:pimeloyl-ACP methyl ester carboxylesterase